MTIVIGYIHGNNIVIISDGRRSRIFPNKDPQVINDNEVKLVVHNNQFVVAHLGMGGIEYNNKILKDTKKITEHFFKENEKILPLLLDKDGFVLIENLVKTWNITFSQSFELDYKDPNYNYSFVVAKWTNGVPQLISYNSHDMSTGEFIGKFSNWDNYIGGDIVNKDVLKPYREIKLNDLTLDESIETIFGLIKEIEVDTLTVGGKKRAYILNEEPSLSYWYEK